MAEIFGSDFVQGWLAAEDAARDAIAVKRAYIDINDGNLYDGLMFSQIMFWHGRNSETGDRRLKVFKEGFYWLAKTYDDWWSECRINARTAKECVSRIKRRGLIVTKIFKFNGVPTVHIRVDWNALESAIRHLMSNPLDSKCPMKKTSNVQSLTETTAQTTSKENEFKSSKFCKAFQENAPFTKKEEDASLNPTHPDPVPVNNCVAVAGSPPTPPSSAPPPSSPKKARKSPLKTTLDIDDEGWAQLPDEDRYKLANFIATRRMQYALMVYTSENGRIPWAIYSKYDKYAVSGRQMYIMDTDYSEEGWEDEVLAQDGPFALRLLRNWANTKKPMDQDGYNRTFETFFMEAQRFLTRPNAKELFDSTPIPVLFPQDGLLIKGKEFLDWDKENSKRRKKSA